MITISPQRFQLKTLHEDISLLDRKLAHLQNFEVFNTQELRDAATRKLHVRRETLVQKARLLTAGGAEYLPSELPASLRAEAELQKAHAEKKPSAQVIPVARAVRAAN